MENLKSEIEKTLAVLKRGGLILYPTDTVWGIGCDATNESAEIGRASCRERVSSPV